MDLVSCHAPRRRKRQYMISAYILQIMDKLAKWLLATPRSMLL
jgi:hypothetical protein